MFASASAVTVAAACFCCGCLCCCCCCCWCRCYGTILLLLLGVIFVFFLLSRNNSMRKNMRECQDVLPLLFLLVPRRKEHTYPYSPSMMHRNRRLTTAGIEVTLHYHQSLVSSEHLRAHAEQRRASARRGETPIVNLCKIITRCPVRPQKCFSD